LSPILIRPIREQIEHDRIIRVLQARFRKQYDVEANIGDERRVPVRVGLQTLYPDLVLTAVGAPRKVQAIIEVETTESVNYLEAMAEWAHYAKAKAPFHLYVPQTLVDIARRLLETHQITVDQLWSYAPLGDQVHFWLVSSNGDGTVVTSVTDSILIAEPAAPAPEPEERPAEGVASRVSPDELKASTARTGASSPKTTPAPARKPAAAPPSKPTKPVQAAKPAKAPTSKATKPVQPAKPAKAAAGKPARPKSAQRAAATKPAAKKPAKPAVKARAVAQPKTSRAVVKARPKAKATTKAKARPAAPPARSKAAKPKRR
jgi:hypothetical protein